jgi:hypothetical protein
MNLAIRLTLDGLVRALKWSAHNLAEGTEQRYRPRQTANRREGAPRRPSRRMRTTGEDHHDRAGR